MYFFDIFSLITNIYSAIGAEKGPLEQVTTLTHSQIKPLIAV